MSRTFPAKYPGECAAGCGDRIGVDDEVTYVDDQLVHADCAKHGAPPPLPGLSPVGRFLAPCASCHLVHAGECF